MTSNDMELVRDYAARRSEQAFETLVSRHVDLVYATALRQVRDPHLSEEITQAVFIILAKKSGALSSKTILSGWLYRTTCYVARDALRTQRRRQHYEQEAGMQSTLQDETRNDLAWQELSPLLDQAMIQLAQSDRDALVLRFFENKSLQEIGAVIGTNEEAAKKRVSRAVEKLQRYFSKRGVTSSADAITGAISANALQAAPAALIKTITVVALAKGATASISTSTLIKGALKIMAWSNAKTAVVATVAVVLTAGTTTVVIKEVHRSHVAAYHPIPDNEPEVTARVWALDRGELGANDYTPEYWQQMQQERKSFNPDPVKVAAAVGPLVDVTLVERTTDHGRPSYLYRLKYGKLKISVLFRLILDGQKIAYAKGYPEPK